MLLKSGEKCRFIICVNQVAFVLVLQMIGVPSARRPRVAGGFRRFWGSVCCTACDTVGQCLVRTFLWPQSHGTGTSDVTLSIRHLETTYLFKISE